MSEVQIKEELAKIIEGADHGIRSSMPEDAILGETHPGDFQPLQKYLVVYLKNKVEITVNVTGEDLYVIADTRKNFSNYVADRILDKK